MIKMLCYYKFITNFSIQVICLGFSNTFLSIFIRAMLINMALFLPSYVFPDLYLKDKMQQAQAGDYIVASINNCYNVLLIRKRLDDYMSIEEITAPSGKLRSSSEGWKGWKQWVESGAPGHTSWVVYMIHLPSGRMQEYYSYTLNSWGNVSPSDNFLSTLLSLRLSPVPRKEMKKIGPKPPHGAPDNRRFWQPKVFFEGSPIEEVEFNAWKTQWPADSSEMSRKAILVYLPNENYSYPSYFPYWLQIHGWTGKAKVHMIDSGKNLVSPRPAPPRYAPISIKSFID
jgi:hypothetical protein